MNILQPERNIIITDEDNALASGIIDVLHKTDAYMHAPSVIETKLSIIINSTRVTNTHVSVTIFCKMLYQTLEVYLSGF